MDPNLLKDPEQIKQLISMLQGLLPTDDGSDTTHHNESKIKTKTRSAKNNKSQNNKFLSMPERNMHKDDISVDQKLSINPPTPRTRRYEPINVRCRVCGKTESVNPSIITDSVERYKCNKCAVTGG